MKEVMNYVMLIFGAVWLFVELRASAKQKDDKRARSLRMQRMALAVITIMASLMGITWSA